MSFDIVISVVGLCEAEEKEWQRADPKIFLCIPVSAYHAAAVNPKRIKTLLANGVFTFFINGNPAFSNGPRSQQRNHPDCTILDNWVTETRLEPTITYFVNEHSTI